MRTKLRPAAEPQARGRAPSPPRRPRLDRFETAALLAFAGLSLVVLAGLVLRPLTLTGAESEVTGDQLQYFGWIRSAAEHGVIHNLWDIDPAGRSYFVHPGFLISGLLHRAGLDVIWAYQLLWKPVAIAVVFTGFLAYVRRLLPAGGARWAGLALALFYVTPAAALWGFGDLGEGLRRRLDFMSGEMWPGLYMWGYLMTAIAVGLLPLVLLAVERARTPERRARGPARVPAGRPAAGGALVVSWLQPWQGVVLLSTVVVVEALAWRRDRGASLGAAGPALGAVLLAGAAPLAYYLVLSRVDPSWELAGEANRSFESWPASVWLLALAPLAVPAALAYRLPAPGWQELAVRVLPLAMVAEYWLISLSGAGTFPFHSLQGMSLALGVLAVTGARGWWPARGRLARPWVAAAAVALLTVPGVAHKLNLIRDDIHVAGQPYFYKPQEEAALDLIERSPRAGGVLAPIYGGLMVPARTGREAWVGQVSWTPDYKRRVARSEALFTGRLGPAAAAALVRESGAVFLFSDCQRRADLSAVLAPLLSSTRRFGCATVYEVRPAALARSGGSA